MRDFILRLSQFDDTRKSFVGDQALAIAEMAKHI